jgi:hypothetical protein
MPRVPGVGRKDGPIEPRTERMHRYWKLAICAGLTVGGRYLIGWLTRRMVAEDVSVHRWPSPLGSEGGMASWRPAVFFRLSAEEQIWVLTELIREQGHCRELESEAARQGRDMALDAVLISLLPRKDRRMHRDRPEASIAAAIGGRTGEVPAPGRIDDGLFKDDLLVILSRRARAHPNILPGIMDAYDITVEPYVRMSIIRAVARIGGPLARRFLERVISEETVFRSLAAKEAQRLLKTC